MERHAGARFLCALLPLGGCVAGPAGPADSGGIGATEASADTGPVDAGPGVDSSIATAPEGSMASSDAARGPEETAAAPVGSGDAAGPADAADGGCNTITAAAAVAEAVVGNRSGGPVPQPLGGAVASGTYDMTAYTVYYNLGNPASYCGVTGQPTRLGDTIAFTASSPGTGTYDEVQFGSTDDGGAYSYRIAGTYVAQYDGGSFLIMTPACPTPASLETSYLYSATPTQIQMTREWGQAGGQPAFLCQGNATYVLR